MLWSRRPLKSDGRSTGRIPSHSSDTSHTTLWSEAITVSLIRFKDFSVIPRLKMSAEQPWWIPFRRPRSRRLNRSLWLAREFEHVETRRLGIYFLDVVFHIDCLDYARRVTLPLLIVLCCYTCAHNATFSQSPPSLHCVPQGCADRASGEKGLVPRLNLKGSDGDAGPKLCLGC